MLCALISSALSSIFYEWPAAAMYVPGQTPGKQTAVKTQREREERERNRRRTGKILRATDDDDTGIRTKHQQPRTVRT